MVLCWMCTAVSRIISIVMMFVIGVPVCGFAVKYYKWDDYRTTNPLLGAEPMYSLTFWEFSKTDATIGLAVVGGAFFTCSIMYLVLYVCAKMVAGSCSRGKKKDDAKRRAV